MLLKRFSQNNMARFINNIYVYEFCNVEKNKIQEGLQYICLQKEKLKQLSIEALPHSDHQCHSLHCIIKFREKVL